MTGWAHAQTVRIASISPLSGPQAGLGDMIRMGVQLAIEEAQPAFEQLGLKLEFAPQDDQASPDVGVAVGRRLVNDPNLLAIIGHLNSGVAIPASEVYKDFNLAMISPANTAPRVTERRYPNVNRVCGRDDVQGPVGAEFAVEELKAQRIYVIHDKTAYGQGIAEAFRDRALSLGARIVGFAGTEEKSNFQSLILQIRALKPDLIYFGGIYDQGGVLIKQIRERGVKAMILGPDALDSSEFVKIAQEAAKGVYYTTVAGSLEQFPDAKAFSDAFQAKFKRMPESYAFYSYDAANVALAAIREAHAKLGRVPTREEVCKAIRAASYKGITGQIEFDEKGDRRQSDYFVIYLKEAKYPGVVIKAIAASAPST